jgi:hypothetical protein
VRRAKNQTVLSFRSHWFPCSGCGIRSVRLRHSAGRRATPPAVDGDKPPHVAAPSQEVLRGGSSATSWLCSGAKPAAPSASLGLTLRISISGGDLRKLDAVRLPGAQRLRRPQSASCCRRDREWSHPLGVPRNAPAANLRAGGSCPRDRTGCAPRSRARGRAPNVRSLQGANRWDRNVAFGKVRTRVRSRQVTAGRGAGGTLTRVRIGGHRTW